MYNNINIPKNHTDIELFTDASNQGWGGALIGLTEIYTVNNTWNQEETELHINVKELLACLHSVQHFKNTLRNKVVLLNIDSKVTNGWLRKQSSIRNNIAQEIIGELLKIMKQYNIQIITKWIQGKNNTIADSLSRHSGNIQPETSISNDLFDLICRHEHLPRNRPFYK